MSGIYVALVLLLAVTTDAGRVVSNPGRSLLQAPAPGTTDPIVATAMSAVSAETQKDVAAFISGAGNATFEANLISQVIANASVTAFNAEATANVYTDQTAAVQAIANAVNNAFISAVAKGSNNDSQLMAKAQSSGLNVALANALLSADAPAPGSTPAGRRRDLKAFPIAIIAIIKITKLVAASTPIVLGVLQSKTG